MSEIEVKIASRYIKRKSSNAVGKNILKTLTEPITNSDDSYRILTAKSNNNEATYPITIQINKESRLVRIIDQAEGMTTKDLEEKFETYGAEKSGAYSGYGVRGIFGQGISDVLFYHSQGTVKSIKDGEASICKFYERGEKRFINVERIEKNTSILSKEWGINSSNGTVIEFIADKDTVLHEFENMANKLSGFYMLRLINTNDNRKVILQHTNRKGGKREAVIKYVPQKGELVEHKEFTMQFENYAPVKIDVDLYKSSSPLSMIGDERESGLLVYDDKDAVYDQTFFGLDNFPGADKYYGFMKLTGAREIILAKINSKKHPEEILSDTRDGFNQQHEFYKNLEQIIKDWLYPILNKGRRSLTNGGLSEATQERHKLAFDELNKLHSQLTGESAYGTIRAVVKKRPAGGMEFARSQIMVTAKKKYGLQLAIDTRIIKPGSLIKVTSSKKNIGFTPESIKVEKPDENADGVLIKTITIYGTRPETVDTLVATFERRKASVVITVIHQDIFYPENGIAFNPDYFSAIVNRESKLNLYIDSRFIKNGDQIKLTSSNKHIKLKLEKLILSPKNFRHGVIVKYPVIFVGEKTEESGTIEAHCKEYSAQVRIDIKDKSAKKPSSLVGKFRGWDFDEKVTMPFQATYDPYQESETCGFILINPNHPINVKYFGENPKKSDVEKSTIAQLYLAETILNESLNVTIPEAIQKGTLPKRSDYDVLYYISQKKYEYGPSIYRHFAVEANYLDKQETKLAEKTQYAPWKTITEGLGGREKLMIELKFGLNEQRPHTLEEIAKKFEITRERVRQIIEAALEKKYGYKQTEEQIDKPHKKGLGLIEKEESNLLNLQDRIISNVAKLYGISVSEMKRKTRQSHIVIPRQVAAYLLRDMTGLSFPSIGKIFDLDHTTVMYAMDKISTSLTTEEDLRNQVDSIRKTVLEGNSK